MISRAVGVMIRNSERPLAGNPWDSYADSISWIVNSVLLNVGGPPAAERGGRGIEPNKKRDRPEDVEWAVVGERADQDDSVEAGVGR
jgi:hypothetical protein